MNEFKDQEPEEVKEEEDSESEEEEEEDEYDEDNTKSNAETVALKMQRRTAMRTDMKAKANFMKLILQSQMINTKKAAHFIESEWGKVSRFVPNLKPDQNALIVEIFISQCDILFELHQTFSPSGFFKQKDFLVFMDDCDVFPLATSIAHATKIYSR